MKTFDKKDVFSWSDIEKAKSYIGKKGYFANNLKWLQKKIDDSRSEILEKINEEDSSCFLFDNLNACSCLFIPADKIKKNKEKKLRSFRDFNEFTNLTNKKIGDIIHVKEKCTTNEFNALIIEEFIDCNLIGIGEYRYTFVELFQDYEWLNPKDEWQPFGVEE